MSSHGVDFVRGAYRLVLGRDPDPAGLVEYVRKLDTGFGKRAMLVELCLSPEGRARGADPARYRDPAAAGAGVVTLDDLLMLDGPRFVEEAYVLLLGRCADASGLAHYGARLAQGASREQIVAEIASSDEYMRVRRDVPGVERLVAARLGMRRLLVRAVRRLLRPQRAPVALADAARAEAAAAGPADRDLPLEGPAPLAAHTAPRARVANAVRAELLTLPTLEQRSTRDRP